MSELQDAAQIIRVTFEGTEILMKLGKANIDFVKGVCAVFINMLRQEKLAGAAGKTCRKDFCEKTPEVRRGSAGI